MELSALRCSVLSPRLTSSRLAHGHIPTQQPDILILSTRPALTLELFIQLVRSMRFNLRTSLRGCASKFSSEIRTLSFGNSTALNAEGSRGLAERNLFTSYRYHHTPHLFAELQ